MCSLTFFETSALRTFFFVPLLLIISKGASKPLRTSTLPTKSNYIFHPSAVFFKGIVPLNSLHHTNSFSLAHEGSRWQRYGNTSFVPSLSFCVSSCLPSMVSLQLLHYSFNVSPSRLLLHHLPSFARVLLFSFCKPGPLFLYSPSLTL